MKHPTATGKDTLRLHTSSTIFIHVTIVLDHCYRKYTILRSCQRHANLTGDIILVLCLFYTHKEINER